MWSMTSFVASFVLPTGEGGLSLPFDLLAAIAILSTQVHRLQKLALFMTLSDWQLPMSYVDCGTGAHGETCILTGHTCALMVYMSAVTPTCAQDL